MIRNLQDWLYFSSMNGGTKIQKEALDIAVNAIEKQIQTEESFEWCDGCKEYDQEKMIVEALPSLYPLKDYEEDAIHAVIDALPPAQPEIIRCKDCKYNATSKKCLNPNSFFLVPADDDFCSYAEKREVAT